MTTSAKPKTSMDICLAAGLSVDDATIVIDICRRSAIPLDVALKILQTNAQPVDPGISAEELEGRLKERE